MRGLGDITVIAHSKGGAVAEAFMALRQWSLVNAWGWATVMPHEISRRPVPVSSHILIDPVIEGPGAWLAVLALGGRPYDVTATVPVVTINPTPELLIGKPPFINVPSWIGGTIRGAHNIQTSRSDHSLMVDYARPAMYLVGQAASSPDYLGW
jgi:hypothetical protein